MAKRFQTRSSGRRSFTKKPRDLLWISKIVEIVVTDASTNGGNVVTNVDWTAVPGVAFENATLLRVVGTVMWQQTANATSSDVPYCLWALYKDADSAGIITPVNAPDLNETDILRWSGFALQSTAAATNNPIQREEIDIRTKRKIDTSEAIKWVAAIPADTATPSVNLIGAFRFLIDRS